MERICPAEEIEEEIRALEYSVQVKKEVESTIEETSMLGKVKKASFKFPLMFRYLAAHLSMLSIEASEEYDVRGTYLIREHFVWK